MPAMKGYVWHSKAGKLAAELEKSGFSDPTWKMLERALDLAYEQERAADSLQGRLQWAQDEMVKIACNSGRLAVRGYQISSDTSVWEFAGKHFESGPIDTVFEEDKKTLREPFTERYGKICAPIEWVRDHCKELK
jgi:hypothetical protein